MREEVEDEDSCRGRTHSRSRRTGRVLSRRDVSEDRLDRLLRAVNLVAMVFTLDVERCKESMSLYFYFED
jgi:hypothetical protein